MISVDMVFLGTGSVLAYALDAAFYRVPHGWRYMVGLGAVPSTLLGLFLFFCPESPRQLLFHNRPEECVKVVSRIYPNATEEQIQQKVMSIRDGVTYARSSNEEFSTMKALKHLFLIPANFRALIAACGLMAFQQFCGFNTLMYYSSTLFQIVSHQPRLQCSEHWWLVLFLDKQCSGRAQDPTLVDYARLKPGHLDPGMKQP